MIFGYINIYRIRAAVLHLVSVCPNCSGGDMESLAQSDDLDFVLQIAAACSFIYVCFRALADSCHSSRPPLPGSTRPSREWHFSMHKLDGAEIFAFRVARTLGIFGLIILRLCQSLSKHNADHSSVVYAHLAFYVSVDFSCRTPR